MSWKPFFLFSDCVGAAKARATTAARDGRVRNREERHAPQPHGQRATSGCAMSQNIFLASLVGRTPINQSKKKARHDRSVRGPAAAAGAGGVLSLWHRTVFLALAFGVRAKDGGVSGILSERTKTAWDM